MSLIPSESYSFPDHFTKTVAGSRKQKNAEPEPESEPVEPPRRKPTIVALPNPKPQPAPAPVAVRQNPEPVCKATPPAPNPALRRAAAPPPRVSEPPIRKIALPPSLKPKVRWKPRPRAMDPAPTANNGNGAEHFPEEPLMPPAQNVIQMKPAAPPPRPPRLMPRPENFPVVSPAKPVSAPPPPKPIPVARPALPVQPVPPRPTPVAKRPVQPVTPVRENLAPMVAANPQADFFEAFAQTGETAISKRRRKAKVRRFIVYESIALGILLPLAFLGLTYRVENVVLHWTMNISTIAAAFAAALIPILFFAATPTLPEIER
jgi:hypothetical protein